jgi:hypothetical protein
MSERGYQFQGVSTKYLDRAIKAQDTAKELIIGKTRCGYEITAYR